MNPFLLSWSWNLLIYLILLKLIIHCKLKMKHFKFFSSQVVLTIQSLCNSVFKNGEYIHCFSNKKDSNRTTKERGICFSYQMILVIIIILFIVHFSARNILAEQATFGRVVTLNKYTKS